MNVYRIPTKAIKEYTKLCKAENEEEARGGNIYASAKAAGYIQAVGDICGHTVAGLVICEADGILANPGAEMADAFDKIIKGDTLPLK